MKCILIILCLAMGLYACKQTIDSPANYAEKQKDNKIEKTYTADELWDLYDLADIIHVDTATEAIDIFPNGWEIHFNWATFEQSVKRSEL